MMVVFNHAVGAVLSPMGIWFLAMIAVAICAWKKRVKTAWWIAGVATFVLWTFSCGWSYRILGGGLEGLYPPVPAETAPQADAIVILGGGMSGNPEVSPYPEMNMAADRVWHAARLWKAGKAPVVISSGANDLFTTKPLLKDFGLPEEAILVENESRNTEENAKFVARFLADRRRTTADKAKSKVLLVTSAFHMRRAKFMFERYAPDLEVVAAPCDHEALQACGQPWHVKEFFPGGDALMRNGYIVKELVGYYGYKLFRR